MSSELNKFQQDLLTSVRQMRQGKAAKVTKVKLPDAAVARAKAGLSQQDFALLLGVSPRTLGLSEFLCVRLLGDFSAERREPPGEGKSIPDFHPTLLVNRSPYAMANWFIASRHSRTERP
jgi:putative transcriptional regulator